RYLAILGAIDTPVLKAQYDPSNCVVAGEDPYALLDRVLPRLGTMQASDRTLVGGTAEDLRRLARDPQHGYAKIVRHGVIGERLLDYDRILGTLRRARYAGWVSIEDGEGPTEEVGWQTSRRAPASSGGSSPSISEDHERRAGGKGHRGHGKHAGA